jgi:hypothetical protein
VSGSRWAPGLDASRQNYVVVPDQPWLDGYCVAKGVIRQFVAMPLGRGNTAEEQITGAAEHGGTQIQAFPMKPERYRLVAERWQRSIVELAAPMATMESRVARPACAAPMGLAPGGRMRQHLYADEYGVDAWDLTTSARCFVTILDSASWRATTGEVPPTRPPSAKEYSQAGLPWFNHYAEDKAALEGAGVLAGVKSVFGLGKEKGETPLPENDTAEPAAPIELGSGPRRVREASL